MNEELARIRASMALLEQNAEGCALNHYANDSDKYGMPGWLIDTKADLERFSEILAVVAGDASLLDWLEQATKASSTGISFDWVSSVDGEPSGFRFMRRHSIGEQAKTIRESINLARLKVSA